jgi:hypothetical protein
MTSWASRYWTTCRQRRKGSDTDSALANRVHFAFEGSWWSAKPQRSLLDLKSSLLARFFEPAICSLSWNYVSAIVPLWGQCPGGVTEQAWRQAIDEAGRFLAQWEGADPKLAGAAAKAV